MQSTPFPQSVLDLLRDITAGCRLDMHEPDEQGITASVTGTVFDNAGVPGELNLVIKRNGGGVAFNIANLVALARAAKSWEETPVLTNQLPDQLLNQLPKSNQKKL